jgi:hypothetical protein
LGKTCSTIGHTNLSLNLQRQLLGSCLRIKAPELPFITNQVMTSPQVAMSCIEDIEDVQATYSLKKG